MVSGVCLSCLIRFSQHHASLWRCCQLFTCFASHPRLRYSAFVHVRVHQAMEFGSTRPPSDMVTVYDVIDTSNVMDHVGLLNLLCAVVPLLSGRRNSVLYTESRLQGAEVSGKLLETLLHSNVTMSSLLFGIALSDTFWDRPQTLRTSSDYSTCLLNLKVVRGTTACASHGSMLPR